MRVPVPDGSVTDLVAVLDREVTVTRSTRCSRLPRTRARWPASSSTRRNPIVSGDIIGSS